MDNLSDKIRVGFYIEKGLLKKCDMMLEAADVRSRNEFVSAAIRQYIGFLESQDAQEYIAAHLSSAIAGVVQTSENRISRLLFKLAVEMSIMMNILAARSGMDETMLRKLRGKCVEDVKKSVGTVDFDEAVRFQKRRDE